VFSPSKGVEKLPKDLYGRPSVAAPAWKSFEYSDPGAATEGHPYRSIQIFHTFKRVGLTNPSSCHD